MRKLLRALVPVLILGLCISLGLHLIKTAPEAKRRPSKPMASAVEVMELKPTDYQVKIESQGAVMPHTQTILVSEIGGRVVEISSAFRNGGFFDTDQMLVKIDHTEYQLEVDNMEAALLGVQARLSELDTKEKNLEKSREIEQQQLDLAERQFKRHGRLHKQGTVSQSTLEQSERELLLRRASLQGLLNSLALVPAQRQTLESEYKLKQAQLDQARLDLERTQISAPYPGRVLEKQIGLGQSVSKGTVLGSVYAIDRVEVRLPVMDLEAAFLLPATSIQGTTIPLDIPVSLYATIGDQEYVWRGRVVRTEGSIDTRTRQLYLIAQISEPYSPSTNGRPPLQVGQFLRAEIDGRILEQVFVLPRQTLRAGNEIMMVDAEQRIQRREVEVVWQSNEEIVVRSGIIRGEQLSLTSLPYTPNGAPVKVLGTGEQGEELSEEATAKRSPDEATHHGGS